MEQLSPIGLLQPLLILAQIWEDISMDFVDGLPSSSVNLPYLLWWIDYQNMLILFLFLILILLLVWQEFFFDNIFKLHGMPKSIVCDRDPTFTYAFWKELFRLNGTSFNFSSNYHPQTDGQSEVVNRTLELLKCIYIVSLALILRSG